MNFLLVRIGRGLRFRNVKPSWFYGLDAFPITQPQRGTNSNPRSPQYITPEIPDSIKTAAQRKTTGECFYITQRFKMYALVYNGIKGRPV